MSILIGVNLSGRWGPQVGLIPTRVDETEASCRQAGDAAAASKYVLVESPTHPGPLSSWIDQWSLMLEKVASKTPAIDRETRSL